MCEHCEQQNIQTLSAGIHVGLNHLDQTESYYPGLNPFEVNYDDMKKAVVIAPGMRYGEAPYDKYIDELLEDMHQGLRTGIDKKEHIKSTLLKFSDRKFKDKDWWGNLTDSELSELMAAVRSYWLPHTAMLDAGLRQAYIFGKFSKALTENTSLEAARKKVMPAKLSVFDEARIDSIQKTAHIFWDKAIDREKDAAAIKLLEYNRDVVTKILVNPDRKDWRSLTSDIYHAINRDKTIVFRDLDRITRTEVANSQNHAILASGLDQGFKYFFVKVRPTACKICKGMYLDEEGKPKRFLIKEFINQPRDVNWGKRTGDKIVPQPPPAHPWCYCKSMTE
ncbi:hypothetical protein KAR91_32300 [Candidatus Pacearchaeota archaeon]|nr:hypothetical protein [Candidatus Pacearchaeota archaeon]